MTTKTIKVGDLTLRQVKEILETPCSWSCRECREKHNAMAVLCQISLDYDLTFDWTYGMFGSVRVFRFKKLRKNGKLTVYSHFITEGLDKGLGWGKTKNLPADNLRHATPEEKRMLLAFEERNGI